MRRLARHTLNALTVLSLLLCVATVALWVRSYRRWDALGYCRPFSESVVFSESGVMIALQAKSPVRYDGSQLGWGRGTGDANSHLESRIRAASRFEWPGIRHFTLFTDLNGDHGFVIPHWLAAILLIALPAYRLLRRRSLQPKRGFCHRCNYDLRATPDRCPECGAVPAAATPTPRG